MLTMIRNFLRARQEGADPKGMVTAPPRRPRLPPGERVYAIGDIHGRLDLLLALGKAVHDDDCQRRQAKTTIILLGDLVDRGPDSAGVVDLVREWMRVADVRVISGNHEELFLHSFTKVETFRGFLKFGGYETIVSYGVDPEALASATLLDAQKMMIDAVPAAHREFIEGFEKLIVIGDYLFVHAGVNPDNPLDSQQGHDCRWIREPFLSHPGWLGQMVIHGHTITEEAEFRANRIGIDTGAFASGKLTAIGLEGTERWLIQSTQDEAGIQTFATAA